nr:UbiA family prenyltransferase [Streptomyces scabichelini]
MPYRTSRGALRTNPWVELLRLPALFTVPGDALAGAAAAGARPTPRTLLAIGSSLCLYEAGMALNDWADRTEDAVDRPHRPLPSGRISPRAALAAAGGLTAAGLGLAARAGRRPLAVAGALAATVWSYDLLLKRTAAGPVAMASARALDLLLGAAVTKGDTRGAWPSALALGTHTLATTAVSRHETRDGTPAAPLAALATTTALAWAMTRRPRATAQAVDGSRDTGSGRRLAGTYGTHGTQGTHGAEPASSRGTGSTAVAAVGLARTLWPLWSMWPLRALPSISALSPGSPGSPGHGRGAAPRLVASPGSGPDRSLGARPAQTTTEDAVRTALAVAYAATCARPLFHAALNPSPPLTQRAVGGGIRAMIPLQAALSARSGALTTALLTAALAPAARKFARKVSVT